MMDGDQAQAEGYGIAPRLWPGETFVCVGSGPSLVLGDVARCAGLARVIAVNNAVDLCPWADVLFAGDRDWWLARGGCPGFPGRKFRATRLRAVNEEPEPAFPYPDVTALRFRNALGLDEDRGFLATGGNSGYLAVNLAVHLGALRIVLLGFDMMLGPAGERHSHGDHPAGLRNPEASDLARWAGCFASLVEPLAAIGVSIVNCSRRTAIDSLPRQPIEEEMASWQGCPSPRSSISASS